MINDAKGYWLLKDCLQSSKISKHHSWPRFVVLKMCGLKIVVTATASKRAISGWDPFGCGHCFGQAASWLCQTLCERCYREGSLRCGSRDQGGSLGSVVQGRCGCPVRMLRSGNGSRWPPFSVRLQIQIWFGSLKVIFSPCCMGC